MFLAVAGPALAGAGEVADTGGGQPVPAPGSTAETGWNPLYDCTVPAGPSTLWDLFRCLGGTIDPSFVCAANPDGTSTLIPGPGWCPALPEDYTVHFLTPPGQNPDPPQYGISVLRRVADSGSYEPYRFFLRENDPSIQWTRVTVNRPNLVARIARAVEYGGDGHGNGGGTIEVVINGQKPPIVVTTTNRTPEDIDWDLSAGLLARGYVVNEEANYITVTRDSARHGITQVSYRCTDPVIVHSELRLELISVVPPQWVPLPPSPPPDTLPPPGGMHP